MLCYVSLSVQDLHIIQRKRSANSSSAKKPKQTKTHSNDLSSRMRRLMRPVPHPLAVITSFQPGQSPTDQPQPHGLLVSTFNTVTLAHPPRVSFNIRLPSSTWDAIQASKHFKACSIDNPHIAKHFTQTQSKGPAWWKGVIGKDGILRDWIAGSWWMECRLASGPSVEVGDHMIVVGEVLKAGNYGDWENRRVWEEPLLYANGAYCRMKTPTEAGRKNSTPRKYLQYRAASREA